MKLILQILFILLLSSSSINITGQLELTSGLKYTKITSKEYEYSSDNDLKRWLYKTKVYSLGVGLSYRMKNKIRFAFNTEVSQFNCHLNISETYTDYMAHGGISSQLSKNGNFYITISSLQLSTSCYIPLSKSDVFSFVLEFGYINNLRIRNDSSSGTQTLIEGGVVYPVQGGPQFQPYYTSTSTTTSYSPNNDFNKYWNMFAFNPGLELRTNSQKKINVSATFFYSFTSSFVGWKSSYLSSNYGSFNLNGFGSRITLLYNLSKDK